MKEEALKLADELLRDNTQLTVESAYMIRRLVEELDKASVVIQDLMTAVTLLKAIPQKYCPSEHNKAYEKGFVDGRISLIQSKAHQTVGGMTTKPLSDKEIMDIYKTIPTNFINFPKETIDFVRAIEERHGIK